MRSRLCFLITGFCLLLGEVSVFALQTTDETQKPALHVDLEYRASSPGEILKVTLSGSAEIYKAHVRFFGSKYIFWKNEKTGEHWAFLGLDLDIRPGNYPVSVVVQMHDGSLKTIKKELQIISKEFPIKKLWVEDKYVSPPAQVLDRIRTEAALIRSIYAIHTSEWLAEGAFVVPTGDKAAPNFGERRFFNDQPRSPHSGVDISSPSGTAVKASNSGRVVLAHELYYAGNAVIIDHGLGVFTFYCHFSSILVKIGDRVKKGQIIGEVGATGRVTGPHLHWSLRVHDSRVDPFSLLNLELD